jgi:fatty-acyl-CoA synthase
MQGYLNDPELTERVLADGWYRTGYLAREDADGFLTVVGPVVD